MTNVPTAYSPVPGPPVNPELGVSTMTTKTKAKRTEGPCIIKEYCVDERGRKPDIYIYSADGERCIGKVHRLDEYEELPLDEEAFANAEYIRRAWNMHEELVDGCREALSLLEANHEAWELKINGPTFVRLRALLSKAQP